MNLLPQNIEKVHVPPIKIQGIKTKLVPFIAKSIKWNGKGIWYEPFVGSGAVGFNIAPKRAVFGDNNPYIIRFYKDLQEHLFDAVDVRQYLEMEGEKLSQTPADKNSYYYTVRSRFNLTHSSLDFLFLQRSNFNGMIRFGPNGYNVPFGRKPDRFKKALITKICNQVDWLQQQIDKNDWEFVNDDWCNVVTQAKNNDFTYFDPPYIGRSTEYFGSWTKEDASKLAEFSNERLLGGFAASMWYKNKYRTNDHLEEWKGTILTNEHFYFLGGKEINRNKMIEALIVKPEYLSEGNN